MFARYDNMLLPYMSSANMFHITQRLYEEDAVLCVQVLLLCSACCHASSLASFIKQDSHGHNGLTCCSLSVSL